MADRANHYERAFAAYLQARGVSCIAVDESRRSHFDDQPIKSLDFIVVAGFRHVLLVDVKGRRWTGRRIGERWATADDITSLSRWQSAVGEGAQALLVYVYEIVGDDPPAALTDTFWHEHRRYACVGVAVDDYRLRMKIRSPRWRTVDLSFADFLAVSRPFAEWLSRAESSPMPSALCASAN